MASELDDWITDKVERKFERNEDGKLELLVVHSYPKFQFKLTRGDWESAEARKNGRARPNREIIVRERFNEIHITVDAWEDVSYQWYTVYMFFLIITSIQGVLLVLAINTIRNKNKSANSLLSILLVLITIALLGRASTFDPNVFNWQPKLLFVPELILFTYGPIFYLYIHKLLVIEIKWKWVMPMFIPLIIQLILYLPYLRMDADTFIFRVIDRELFPYFALTGSAALVANTGYWFLFKKIVSKYSREVTSENQRKYVRFLRWVLGIKAVYLFIWLSIVVIYLAGRLFDIDLLFVAENLIDLLWVLFSLIIFALAYYAVKHPEVLREKRKYRDHALNQNEASHIQEKLVELLEHDKVYTEQDLTLESLAHKIPTGAHSLSRFINEQYGQSFTELINTHRVKEFIKRAEQEKTPHFLELALRVGFNSKPTFNRAFKKITGKTPREYFKGGA